MSMSPDTQISSVEMLTNERLILYYLYPGVPIFSLMQGTILLNICIILKRFRDRLLYTKKETNCVLFIVNIRLHYFYLK